MGAGFSPTPVTRGDEGLRTLRPKLARVVLLALLALVVVLRPPSAPGTLLGQKK